MSRRKRRPAEAAPPSADQGRSARPRARRRAPRLAGPPVDVAMLVAVFAVTAVVAELAGAANLGVAFGVGQVAFAVALVVVLLRE